MAPQNQALLRLAHYAVVGRSRAHKTLYTWTKREQVEALMKEPTLLTRTESPEHGPSFFDQMLHKRMVAGDPLAKVLRTTAFARARFGWPAPYATALGFGGESYGDELIRIDLKPEAWIVVLRLSTQSLEVIDLEGNAIANESALASPERIAAVYFMQDQPVTGYAASSAGFEQRTGYREYVVCNESMIEEYSARTAAIGSELYDEAEMLRAFAMHLRAFPAPNDGGDFRFNERVAKKIFPLMEMPELTLSVYEATLAFPVESYRPIPETIERLADYLLKLKAPQPSISYRPKAVFPAPSARKPLAAPNIPQR